MQSDKIVRQARATVSEFAAKFAPKKYFILLCVFLAAMIVISFIFPLLNYGRFFGTDDYTHLFHTKEMASSTGILDFYEKIGGKVADPYSDSNLFNYPFGLWLFGSTISKITGLPVLTAELLFVIIFLFILLGSFYIYAGVFLESKEQRIFSLLFLMSMPTASLSLLSFRPSVFILPFLFILLYIAFKEPFRWKLLPVLWLSIFIITICHTGTFIFLISFTIIFFLIYCLLWGKFSRPIFLIMISTFVIYVITLRFFPQIANQFEVKSTIFLSPGNFFVSKFNFNLPLELSNVLYQNILVEQEFIYAVIMGAFIFALGKTFMYIHRTISQSISRSKVSLFPVTIPSLSISKSVIGVPFWLGPIHLILSILGAFRLNSKGKCVLIAAVLITLTPNMLAASQGWEAITGALREISYLTIIIPISAALGLWAMVGYLDSLNVSWKSLIISVFWVVLLSAIIITPTVATAYYLPKISGENYVIDGMKWVGGIGDDKEKVVGYGYRTVPIYTNKIDASYGIQSGYEIRTFIALLKGAYFSVSDKSVSDLQHYYGVNYILISEKLAENLRGGTDRLQIDQNDAVDKIYSSKDFGIYKIVSPAASQGRITNVSEGITLERTGAAIEVKTKVYKIVLNENYPTIEQFGTPRENYLGAGFMSDSIQIWGFRDNPDVNPFLPPNETVPRPNSTVDHFSLNNLQIPAEISGNQVVYRTILKDKVSGENESSLLVRYSFYPESVKREFLISNDWVSSPTARAMNVQFFTSFFTPMNEFQIIKSKSIVKRKIYPSEDSVIKNEIIQAFYLTNGDQGIYIKNEPTSPYPSELTYKGSTIYNMSSTRLAQSLSVKSGDTFHITQFLSPELGGGTASKNIQARQGIELNDFPDGIVPIMISGYDTPFSGRGSDLVLSGYQILDEGHIPYSEAIVARKPPQNIKINSTGNESQETVRLIPVNTLTVPVSEISRNIKDEKIKKIGSASTKTRFFDNFSVQKNTISSLMQYANNNNLPLIGYMPESLTYNLDTLKIISDNNIPFLLSRYVSPAAYGYSGVKDRNPEMAVYQGEPAEVILLPVSYPTSSSLSYESDNIEVFSAWKITMDDALDDDGLVFFIFRPSEIGDPVFSEDFKLLFAYARDKGLTFTTPDVIVSHFRDLQKIRYDGFIENDMAIINLTNNNDHTVDHVTFKITMPELKSGGYKVNRGEIIRTRGGNSRMILYVSTDIAANDFQEIIITPENPRERIFVTVPEQLIEGDIGFSIKDGDGLPIENANVFIDAKHYDVDENGEVRVHLSRGFHDLSIKSPGFDTFSSTLHVKGRIFLVEKYFGMIS